MKNTDIAKDGQAIAASGNPAEVAKAEMTPVPGTASQAAMAGARQVAGRNRAPQTLLEKIAAKAATLRLGKEDEEEELDEIAADDAEAEAAADEAPADSVDTGGATTAQGAAQPTEAGAATAAAAAESTGFLSGVPPIVYAIGAAGLVGGGIAIFRGGGDDKMAAPGLALKSDTGASASDFITQDGTINVSAITSGNTWEYSTDGGATWTAGSGTSFTLAEGSYAAGAVQVRQKDTAGTVSEVAKIANAIKVDNTAADAPVINAVAGDDVVAGAEMDEPVVVSGTAEAGTSVKVTWGTATKTVTVGTDGTWTASFAAAELPADGAYEITATATDAAGNVSASGARPVTVDSSNYITGMVAAGPVIAGIEVKAYKADGTLLGSTVTDANGSFSMAFKDYSGLVLFSAIDPTVNSQGYLDEATGTQADIDVMLRAVAVVTAGQDITVNITPFTEVSTRLMSPDLATPGTTSLGSVSESAVANANATVATLFTDGDPALVGQDVKLVIDGTGASTFGTANVYGIYLAALQGWAQREDLTLDETIQQIVDAINSTAKGANTTLADLGTTDGNFLVDLLLLGFGDVTGQNTALADAVLPSTYLGQLGMVDDLAGPSFAAPEATVSLPESQTVGTVIHIANATDVVGGVTYSIDWGSAPNPFNIFASIQIEDFFTIDPQTGVVMLVGPLDHEAQPTLYVNVTATDFWGNQSVQTLTVNVENVNEAPEVISPLLDQVLSVNQVFTYNAADAFSDVDGSTLTYSAVVVDGQGNTSALPSWMTIDAQTGQLSAASVEALASAVTIRVTASDGEFSVSDDFSVSTVNAPVITGVASDVAAARSGQTVLITVTFSEAVTIGASTPSLWFQSNLGTWIAPYNSAATSSLNEPNKLVFTAMAGAGDASDFRLDVVSGWDVRSVATGELASVDVLNQQILFGSQPFVLDNTLPSLVTNTFTVNENTTAVAQLAATEAVTWTLNGGLDSSLFSLSSSGELSFVASRNYETQAHSYSVNVTMTDAAGNSMMQTVTVNLDDVNEAPYVATGLVDQTTVQGQPFSYAIASNSFADVDAGTTLTYTAQVVGAGGALSALPSWLTFDAATQTFSSAGAGTLNSPITVRVTASDGSLSVSDDFEIDQAEAPTFTTTLTGVTNLDVRSNLVFQASENLDLTTVDGTYEIVIVNDANTVAKAGYSGTAGESTDNRQTLLVTVSGGVVSAELNGSTVNINDLLTISGNTVIINPLYDLDFSNNYHVYIEDGLFVGETSGVGNVAFNGASFSTVTPGSNLATAASSLKMDTNGQLEASHNWIGIDNLGSTVATSPTSLGSLGSSSYALVATDRDPGAAIATWDFWVRATDFGADDLFYLDEQTNAALLWTQTSIFFSSGDVDFDDTRIDFGTYAGTPLPISSQSFVDLNILDAWQADPATAQAALNSPTPLFVGG